MPSIGIPQPRETTVISGIHRNTTLRVMITAAGLWAAVCRDVRPCLGHPGLHHDWAEATAAMAEDPFAVQPRLSRARVARLEGRHLAAYFEARWARALAPHDAEPLRVLGLAALDLGLQGEGLDHLDAFFAAGGEAFDARVARAKARWSARQQAEALDDMDRALALKPDVDAALLRASWRRQRRQLTEAAAGLSDVLTRVQDALLVRRALVEVRLEQGQPQAALELVEEALTKNPRSVEWLLAKARALTASGEPETAHQTLLDALVLAEAAAQQRATPMLITQRAEVRLALGDRAGARRDLDLALTKGPPFPRALELSRELGRRAPRGQR